MSTTYRRLSLAIIGALLAFAIGSYAQQQAKPTYEQLAAFVEVLQGNLQAAQGTIKLREIEIAGLKKELEEAKAASASSTSAEHERK